MPFGPVTIYVHLQFSIITPNSFVAAIVDTLLPTDVYYRQAPSFQVSANQAALENPFLIVPIHSILDIPTQALNTASILKFQTPKPILTSISNLALDATLHAAHCDTLGIFLRSVHLHSARDHNTP